MKWLQNCYMSCIAKLVILVGKLNTSTAEVVCYEWTLTEALLVVSVFVPVLLVHRVCVVQYQIVLTSNLLYHRLTVFIDWNWCLLCSGGSVYLQSTSCAVHHHPLRAATDTPWSASTVTSTSSGAQQTPPSRTTCIASTLTPWPGPSYPWRKTLR